MVFGKRWTRCWAKGYWHFRKDKVINNEPDLENANWISGVPYQAAWAQREEYLLREPVLEYVNIVDSWKYR